ncbi:MAG: L-threonine 3-dehydrogenase [Rickettsiales bacterium]|nr:L-threonine 3-dehydrogenase [Rickettsiales bacterium]
MKMKALVKKDSCEGIWLQEVEKPTPAAHEVLIRTHYTGICGTDIHIYNWDEWAQKTIPVPMTIGHEFVGEIVEMGSQVKGFEMGQIVSAEGHIVCGRCRMCYAGKRHLCRNTVGIGVHRDGAMAEFVTVPQENLWKTLPEIPAEHYAIFDPYGNAVHTAASFDLLGEDVLITGAGPIGCMAVAIAKHSGARKVIITDVNEYRLDLARKMGATQAVNVTKKTLDEVMAEEGMTEGFDVGLEMSGNPSAFADMIRTVRNGAKIALLGILPPDTSIAWDEVAFKGLEIKGIYGREMFETWYKMQAMLQTGLDIAPVLTHRFHYNDFQEAFDIMRSGQSGKIVLDWRG